MNRKRFGDLENGIKLFEKIKSGYLRLEEVKKYQHISKANLNKTRKEMLQ